ncbi:MAG: SPOR domain-containing protein [Spirochaetaceae bacterium]|jgi:DedD protein|nr:SPOR domain-containing protein [Spirochaetaceae bacterium]
MEKKKLLLVSVSVGLFLVIVIGASILAFSPRSHSAVETLNTQAALKKSGSNPVAPGLSSVSAGNIEDGNDGINFPPGVKLLPPPVSSGSPEGSVLNSSEIGNTEAAIKVERAGEGTQAYLTIPSPSNGSSPVNTERAGEKDANVRFEPPKSSTHTEIASVPVRPVKKEAAPVSNKSSRPAEKKSVAPVKSETKEVAGSTKQSRSDYWVQAGSFSQKSRADNTKSFLAEKGIGAIIIGSNVNGKTVYRVRVGPYTSQSEANYWLSLIKEIDGMNDSLVWKSTTNL